ncbi:MAG: UDP-N-acetylmuramoyl-L-alanyl-D-glutamate--2,6-diaminopimelate ligase [Planctomycetes bacterium]|nr:UDP-N-acetylmuramoyl-L-alanyl-D-glutamate--2,6-diaminopimelate ligase [Planctomycetota bacterium]
MKLDDLFNGLGSSAILNSNGTEIIGVTCDSRKVRPGFLFAAFKGYKIDGRKFIQDAIKRGASAILTDVMLIMPENVALVVSSRPRRLYARICARFMGDPAKNLRLMGVTGTNGKTTITYIIKDIFDDAGFDCGMIGTVDNYLGNSEKVSASMTTPDPENLQYFLRRMSDNGLFSGVMEVSSHALAMNRTTGIKFDAGIFTNLTRDHLDFHHNFSDYAKTKAKFFKQVKSDGVAVVNGDDEYCGIMMKSCLSRIVTYGIKFPHTFHAKDIELSARGTTFDLVHPGGVRRIHSPLLGNFNVYNILAAFATAINMGISASEIEETVAKTKGAPGRLEKITPFNAPMSVIVDYAHSPDALENVLSTLRKVSKGKIYTVVGAGGNRDKTKRPLMGAIAEKLSDKVFVTSDNPRTENPDEIISDIENGMTDKNKREIIPDREKAIAAAIKHAQNNEIVLIAGKGHEDYQILGKKTVHFDDREIGRFYFEHYHSGKIVKSVSGKGIIGKQKTTA